MAEWFSGDVVANGIRTHYYRTGGDKPPLVLCHGATDDGLCWTPVARALEADYDVVMPDARGHGLSAAPDDGYGSEERAADLAGLIGALGLGTPVVGGHSMGAQTTFRLAADRPDLVRCAILEDPGFRPRSAQANDAESVERRERMRQNIAELQAKSRDEVMAQAREQHPTWAEDELPPWADSKLRVSPKFVGSIRFAEQPPWWELLPKVACPVLLITADPEKGAIVTPEAAEEATRLNRRVQVVRLRGAGHNVRREQSDGFMQAVRAFLAETYAAPRAGR